MSKLRMLMGMCVLIPCVLLGADEGKARTRHTKFPIEGGRLKLPTAIEFEPGDDVLKKESIESLWMIADFLEARQDVTLLRIEGHLDRSENRDACLALSQKRAMAVAKWLTSHGVDCRRLMAVGFGDSKPLESNDTPAGRSANRRIEARPAALRGKLIGGLPADGGGKSAGDVCEKR